MSDHQAQEAGVVELKPGVWVRRRYAARFRVRPDGTLTVV